MGSPPQILLTDIIDRWNLSLVSGKFGPIKWLRLAGNYVENKIGICDLRLSARTLLLRIDNSTDMYFTIVKKYLQAVKRPSAHLIYILVQPTYELDGIRPKLWFLMEVLVDFQESSNLIFSCFVFFSWWNCVVLSKRSKYALPMLTVFCSIDRKSKIFCFLSLDSEFIKQKSKFCEQPWCCFQLVLIIRHFSLMKSLTLTACERYSLLDNNKVYEMLKLKSLVNKE